MCGICGIVVPRGVARQIDHPRIERMRDSLRHRGPDGEGVHVAEGVALGHRRLSIIDVAHGQQPMPSDDGSLQIVYNGEIYNHLALKAELEAQGQHYRTRCDTETVLRLYELIGDSAPERLRGMFAFGIWNASRHRLFLARDRLGIKPLYYTVAEDGTLAFASEIKALLAVGWVRPKLNLNALPDFLANHAPSAHETLFEGVYRVPPGHTLSWQGGAVTLQRYWKLSFGHSSHPTWSDADWIDAYREQFREAVRLRLMSDVPLGMFLSGGIDSAAISAMMSSLVEDPIKTFSVAFAEREANELSYARLVAARYRTDHHEIVVRPEEFFQALPTLVWHEDEPIAHPSSVALHFVSRLAADHVKVVLTGEGSDETLAGYGRYRTTLYNLALGARYQRLTGARVQRLVRAAIDRLPKTTRLRRRLLRTGLYLPADLNTLYFDNFAVFGQARQGSLLAPALREQLAPIDPYEAAHTALATSDASTLLNQLLDADMQTYLHELLMKQDQMSMAASIESRVPFLDHELVEFTAQMPERMKLRGLTTKFVLRKVMRDALPREILRRRKMGFPVPVGQWFRGPFRSLLDDFVLGGRAQERGLFEAAYVEQIVAEHDARVADHSERLWTLMNCEIWHRIFIDGEQPPTIGVAAANTLAAHV
jgi:asparagine synthase (glutamine-hydrolysing)